VENQGAQAGRKEVERFVGQLREFGGNGRFNRRVRRTRRFVISAALLGVALLLLTACGGDTGSSDTGSAGTGEQYDSTGEESTNPISQVCRPPDMENCYGYEDMQAYLDQIIPAIEQFFDTAYTDMPRPAQYLYVPEGETGSTGCTDTYTRTSPTHTVPLTRRYTPASAHCGSTTPTQVMPLRR
jgi:hypothetical protein